MLEIRNIVKKYGKQQVLNGVSLLVENNETKGLIGINGAGKSTLVEIICSVKKADSGDILLDGINVVNEKHNKHCLLRIGYVPQQFSLFNDLTVYENLEYICSIYNVDKTKINDVIKLCELEPLKMKIAKMLSGGYKQVLSLAAAIIHDPKVLILDEPTSSMDPIFRRNFWRIISKYKKSGTSILLITHFLEELLECDSFACLANGVICYDGLVDTFNVDGKLDIESILRKFSAHER